MTFGMGSFECPAKGSFGAMMVGVLVGCLLLVFPNKDGLRWEVTDEEEREGPEEIFGGKGVPLQGERDAFVVSKGDGLKWKLGDSTCMIITVQGNPS
jgi:hypothetical protein